MVMCNLIKKKLDLGSNIHIHSIGELKSTFVSLQVADRSVTYPKGIIEDMLIKVKQYVLPAGFVVLYMKEDYNIPLLLGQPFFL